MSADRFAERHGPWAVVTGASDGIGRAIAVELAARGVDVVVVARRAARLDEVVETIRDHGVDAVAVAADLGTRAGVAEVIERCEHLDVGTLVAAAGFGTSGPFLDNPVEEELAMIDVNGRAVTELSHHFGNRFAARGRGSIVLFGSIVGFQGVARTANYAATKAFVQTLGEGLRVELRSLGVDVLVAAPGPVASGFGEHADMEMGSATRPEVVARRIVRALGRRGTVRPGARSKVLGWSLATAPRRVRTTILGGIMRSFTRHQRAA